MSIVDAFLVPKVTRCPAPMDDGSDTSLVCHKHDEIGRGIVLVWSAVSTLVSSLAGVVMSWANEVGYANLDVDILASNVAQLNSIPRIMGYWTILAVIILLGLWVLSILLVCSRKFTSIPEYVVLGAAMPITVISMIEPLF